MKTILTLCLFAASCVCSFAQTKTFDWAKGIHGASSAEAMAITTDAGGNTYTAGYFFGTADFDPGAAVVNFVSAGSDDIFIEKLDNAGNLLWSKTIGGTLSQGANAITLDKSGGILVTGYFSGTVDFDPGAGVSNLVAGTSANVFVLKLDAGGNFVWVKQLGGTASPSIPKGIAQDGAGNIYVAGYFSGTADFDPGAPMVLLTSAGVEDVFITKLDASGNYIWAKQIGSSTIEHCTGIALDTSANVYTTGFFYNVVDFDPNATVYNLTSAGNNDVFISKLDSAGNFVWAKQLSGSSFEVGYALTTDIKGNVYSTGFFLGTVDFDPGAGVQKLSASGAYDMFISKLDASGNFVWAKQFGGTVDAEGRCIKADTKGNLYTSGWFRGTIDFDPNAPVYNLSSAGSYDIVVLKMDTSGNFILAAAMGGSGDDFGYALEVDVNANIFTAGSFTASADFDPNSPVFSLSSTGSSDIFIHKMHQSTAGIIEQPFTAKGFVYPNPSNQLLYFNFGKVNGPVQIQLINSLGQIVSNEHYASMPEMLNIQHLAAGTYCVKLLAQQELIGKCMLLKAE